MKFYDSGIFHIYNQGNNRRLIFYSEDNYEFFQWKMRAFLKPFGDLIAYCLMPNHFHWLFKVNRDEVKRCEFRTHYDQIEYQRRELLYGNNAIEMKRAESYYDDDGKKVSLNRAIGTLCQSYARALNMSRGESGSLFKSGCHAKDGLLGILNYSSFQELGNGQDYVSRCFHYIHHNPVQACLVNLPEQYCWSSAPDYHGIREESLCNKELGRMLIFGQKP